MSEYVKFQTMHDEWLRCFTATVWNTIKHLEENGEPLRERQKLLMWESALYEFAEDSRRMSLMATTKIPAVRVEPSSDLRQQVFERDEFACQKCGVTNVPLHVDHVLPVFHGGGTSLENLQTLCAACNMSKGVDAVRYVSG